MSLRDMYEAKTQKDANVVAYLTKMNTFLRSIGVTNTDMKLSSMQALSYASREMMRPEEAALIDEAVKLVRADRWREGPGIITRDNVKTEKWGSGGRSLYMSFQKQFCYQYTWPDGTRHVRVLSWRTMNCVEEKKGFVWKQEAEMLKRMNEQLRNLKELLTGSQRFVLLPFQAYIEECNVNGNLVLFDDGKLYQDLHKYGLSLTVMGDKGATLMQKQQFIVDALMKLNGD